jgi:hypothetical protein
VKSWINFCQTARCNIPEASHIHASHGEKLKLHLKPHLSLKEISVFITASKADRDRQKWKEKEQ